MNKSSHPFHYIHPWILCQVSCDWTDSGWMDCYGHFVASWEEGDMIVMIIFMLQHRSDDFMSWSCYRSHDCHDHVAGDMIDGHNGWGRLECRPQQHHGQDAEDFAPERIAMDVDSQEEDVNIVAAEEEVNKWMSCQC